MVPGIFSDLLRYVQMLKRVGCKSNEKLPHLFIPSKNANLFYEFAVEYLPLGRIAALNLELAVKDLPLDRTLVIFYIYTIWGLNVIVFSEKGVSFSLLFALYYLYR